jgi:hypothetical protein
MFETALKSTLHRPKSTAEQASGKGQRVNVRKSLAAEREQHGNGRHNTLRQVHGLFQSEFSA